jgi:hypothetical protein
MRFMIDPKMAPGRVVVKKDGQQVAVASSFEMLPVISEALRRGDETHAHPATMPWVHAWISREERRRRMRDSEARKMRRRRAAQ